MRERAKQLLKDNPNMKLKQFKELTGLDRKTFCSLKREILKEEKNQSNEFGIRIKLKRKMRFELISALKREGYINEKGTFLERM